MLSGKQYVSEQSAVNSPNGDFGPRAENRHYPTAHCFYRVNRLFLQPDPAMDAIDPGLPKTRIKKIMKLIPCEVKHKTQITRVTNSKE